MDNPINNMSLFVRIPVSFSYAYELSLASGEKLFCRLCILFDAQNK
jgi:hypothetical protein